MKTKLFSLLGLFGLPLAASGQNLSINGVNYTGYFGPSGSNVTVATPVIPDGTLLSVTLGGSASGALGTYWQASASGAAVLGTNIIGPTPQSNVADTEAKVSLDGTNLNFGMTNSATSILGSLGVGTSLGMSWSATSKFNVGGTNQLVLAPNTTYQVTFDVNSGNNLLNSTLGITPTFTVSLLDGAGTAVGAGSSGTLVNILGLSLVGVTGGPTGSERATVNFTTGNTVGAGAASLNFSGSATLPTTVGNVGTTFASISNVTINTVPETSSFALALAGGVVTLLHRKRRS